MQRILFVCLGNICRSPLAEGVFRHLIEQRGLEGEIEVDSAGTGAWHVGEAPDPRSLEVAAAHGVSLEGQSARKVSPADFRDFDRVIAMDDSNFRDLDAIAPPHPVATLHRLRDWDPEGEGNVPDPYYTGDDGFEQVYQMVQRSCSVLLDELAEFAR